MNDPAPHVSHSPLGRRRAGILLHPTSLPGPGRSGVLGADAHRFIDWLADSGISVWQVLPLGPTHEDGSPYQCMSTHAGDTHLICLQWLVEWGWLPAADGPRGTEDASARIAWLARAREAFTARNDAAEQAEYRSFLDAQRHWLDDYALYRALRNAHGHRAWWDWPAPLAAHAPDAIAAAHTEHAEAIEQQRFEQFVFFRQWLQIKRHANERGILLFGDMPIFVAHDSAEVWAEREYFAFDANGNLEVVAGVPPDYFSATGQRWGNPHYRWERMQQDGFAWWQARMRTQLAMFDLVRVDHFRGFEAYWEIPAGAETAMEGRWVQAPGDALFAALRSNFDPLPIVAEDLGVITAEVDALRNKYELPGMKILHFAFDGSPDNPYPPHRHEPNCAVYTGTHDNDTTLGWWQSLPEDARRYVAEYLGCDCADMPWPLIRSAFASVARLAVVPMQDVLALDGRHRMNLPGTTQGNWRWRFEWNQVPGDLAGRLRRLVQVYVR